MTIMADELGHKIHVVDWRRPPEAMDVVALGLCGQRFFRHCSHTKVWTMDRVKEYICGACGVTFESDWSEERCLAEMRERFGDIPAGQQMKVCDECYAVYMAEYSAAMKRGAFTKQEPS